MSSWTTGTSSGGTSKRLNTFLMSEDRWQRALKEHTSRVKHVKPAVDLKSPWGCSRPYVPLPPADGSSSQHTSARRGGPSRASNNTGRPTSAASSARPTSAASSGRGGGAGGGGGSRPSSAALQRPTSAMSRTSTYSSGRGAASAPVTGSQVVSHLPLQQQRLCEEMVKLLVGLDREHSKVVLEHLYSNAEESRLLQSYSGVYPGLVYSGGGGGGGGDGNNNDGASFENVQQAE